MLYLFEKKKEENTCASVCVCVCIKETIDILSGIN